MCCWESDVAASAGTEGCFPALAAGGLLYGGHSGEQIVVPREIFIRCWAAHESVESLLGGMSAR